MRIALHAHGLSKSFIQPGLPPVRALDGVSVALRSGEFVILIGPNGSGKSTFMRILAGEVLPDEGVLQLEIGDEFKDWTKLDRREHARHLGRVEQNPLLGTVPGLTVRENLRLALLQRRVPRLLPVRQYMDGEAERRLARVGLAHRLDTPVQYLSGGERQLLALELAQAREPFLLLLDEYTASLDPKHAKACLEETRRLVQENGVGVLLVTHNLLDAQRYGTRLLAIRDGRLVADLGAEEKAGLSVADIASLCGYVS